MPPPKFSLPLPYRIFFLLIEPFSALVGAYYAHFHQPTYLSLTHLASSPPATQPLPLSTSIPLSQLANLYLLFAINEALVLRSTSDLTVWRTLLFGLLVADGGHLWSVSGKGWGVYVSFDFWFLRLFYYLLMDGWLLIGAWGKKSTGRIWMQFWFNSL